MAFPAVTCAEWSPFSLALLLSCMRGGDFLHKRIHANGAPEVGFGRDHLKDQIPDVLRLFLPSYFLLAVLALEIKLP